MHVDRQGNGPCAYVGIPGWAGFSRTFKKLWPYAPPDASFYSLDLPGFGESPPLATRDSEVLLNEIVAAIEALQLDRLTLVAHCAGSGPALTYAQRHPGKVNRIVAIDAFPRLPAIANLLRIPGLGEAFHRIAFGNDTGRRISNYLMRGVRHPETDVTRGLAEADPRIAMRFLPLLMASADIRRYAGLETPIDLAYGERTFRAVHKGLPEWQARFPHVTLHCMHGAGHETILEASEHVAELVFAGGEARG